MCQPGNQAAPSPGLSPQCGKGMDMKENQPQIQQPHPTEGLCPPQHTEPPSAFQTHFQLCCSSFPVLPRTGAVGGCRAPSNPPQGPPPRHGDSQNSSSSLEKGEKLSRTNSLGPCSPPEPHPGAPTQQPPPAFLPPVPHVSPASHWTAKNTGSGLFFTIPVIYLHTLWSCDSLEAVPCFVSSQR